MLTLQLDISYIKSCTEHIQVSVFHVGGGGGSTSFLDCFSTEYIFLKLQSIETTG